MKAALRNQLGTAERGSEDAVGMQYFVGVKKESEIGGCFLLDCYSELVKRTGLESAVSWFHLVSSVRWLVHHDLRQVHEICLA